MHLIEELHKENPSNWLDHELKSPVKIQDLPAKSIRELSERIHILFPKREDRPVIFFDKCSAEADLTKIFYIRTVLRMVGLIGVFMGTNAKACEIPSRSGSSRRDPESYLFGYVVHKLPPMNENKMSSIKEKLKTLISGSSSEKSVKSIKINQIETLFNVLKNERPLFINYAAQYLEEFFCSNDSKAINFYELCTKIRDRFIDFKDITQPHLGLEFLKSQINLMMQNQWEPEEKAKYGSVAINRHIAFLHRPPDVFLTDLEKENNPDIYFPIHTSRSIALHYLMETDFSGKKNKTIQTCLVTKGAKKQQTHQIAM
jgi:hypothetical protein